MNEWKQFKAILSQEDFLTYTQATGIIPFLNIQEHSCSWNFILSWMMYYAVIHNISGFYFSNLILFLEGWIWPLATSKTQFLSVFPSLPYLCTGLIAGSQTLLAHPSQRLCIHCSHLEHSSPRYSNDSFPVHSASTQRSSPQIDFASPLITNPAWFFSLILITTSHYNTNLHTCLLSGSLTRTTGYEDMRICLIRTRLLTVPGTQHLFYTWHVNTY